MGLSNISQCLESSLPPGFLPQLRDIGASAVARGERVYLVGGVVRDLILGQRPLDLTAVKRGEWLAESPASPPVSAGGADLDLDLVVEGDAIALGRRIARGKNWRLRTHPHFGTAKLYQEHFSIDLVMARSEIYPYPGALPAVKPGTIEEDLRRRDFTINSMAACISPDSFGELLDPHGGRSDLGKRLIRILHQASFADDPTRILRALRYEQRLKFHLEQDTEWLLRRHLDNLDTVTGERLWHELELILQEVRPEEVLCRAEELGVFHRLHPALRGDGWMANNFIRARTPVAESISRLAVYLALLVFRLTAEQIEGCIVRLKMPGWAARTGRDVAQLKQGLGALASTHLQPSNIYRRLKRHLPEVIEAAAIASDSPLIQQRLELYLKKLRHIRPEISGDDLKLMGICPGRKMGQILRTLHDARLDQTVTSRAEEDALVRRSL